MEISFTNTGNDEHVFSCTRKDGTITWKKGNSFFICHDLCHYATETILPLQHAFFGMVAAGVDISEFDLPREQRTVAIPDEALFAEHLVNLLVIDFTQGRIEDLRGMMKEIYSGQGGSHYLSLLSDDKIELIRDKIHALMQVWKTVEEKKSLCLNFEN